MPFRDRLVLCLTCVLLTSACTPIAALRETRATLAVADVPNVDVRIKSARESLAEAGQLAKKEPEKALSFCLLAARMAEQHLRDHPDNTAALKVYNYALQRFFGIIRMHGLEPWNQPTKFGEFTVTHRRHPRPEWNPALYEFLPDDQLEIGGKFLKERVTRDGAGASLVAVSKHINHDFARNFALGAKTYYGVTALARFQGNRCEFQFYDPLDTTRVGLAGQQFDLAADFTTPLAVLLTRERPERLGIRRLIDPGRYANTARLIRMRPYDPNRVPLLLVHGLMDTPATWTPMLNALYADPVVRAKYQIWLYSYPSGYPYPYSAELLRQELDRVGKTFPGHKDMVYVGHSMGGVIGRLMLVDTGMSVWNSTFKVPPQKLALRPKDREIIENMLIFKHRDEIDRAIFIAAPHRGSKLAISPLGKIGSRLVRAPSNLLALTVTIKDILLLDDVALNLDRLPNSIDTLSPENRFVLATRDLPIVPGIPYHTIAGNRGRGTPPDCSDGVVPYASSHLPGAESELLVPSNHSAHRNEQAIQEVRRILRLHVGAPPPAQPPQTGEAGTRPRG